ncbi:flagellar export protein FliJ [Haliea sp.]|uniref:flagellar export protein FliJ n=1 Tax=Haliea sp. TaxID=1932666 RepID=UPI0035275B27
MTSPDKLDKVVTVARADQAGAARNLQEQQAHHSRNNDQLNQLRRFADEYEQQLREMSASGMAAAQLQDYRQFLSNLNDAIRLQLSTVAESTEKLQQQRQDWMQKSLQTSTLEDFVARRRILAQEHAERAEQRAVDERFNAGFVPPGQEPPGSGT